MAKNFFITPNSDVQTVGGVEVDFDTTMAADQYYLLVSSTLCWVKQGTAPVAASAADGSTLVPPNTPILINGALGAKLSIVQHTAGGSASLTRVQMV
jgi:hypothetical protein